MTLMINQQKNIFGAWQNWDNAELSLFIKRFDCPWMYMDEDL